MTHSLPAEGGNRELRGLRVDLMLNEPAGNEAISIDRAVVGDPRPIAEQILRLVRFRTRQWWIGRGEGGRRGPMVAAYPIAGDGSIHGEWIHYIETPGTYELPLALTTDVWMQVMQDLAARVDPPIYHERLLDAYYFLAERDLEAAALALANACEIARTQHFERAMRRNDPEWDLNEYLRSRGDLGRNQWSLHTHLHPVAASLFGSGFREAHEDDWFAIRLLWKTRGRVAHGKRAGYEAQGVVRPVSSDMIASWIDPTRRLLEWLEAL